MSVFENRLICAVIFLGLYFCVVCENDPEVENHRYSAKRSHDIQQRDVHCTLPPQIDGLNFSLPNCDNNTDCSLPEDSTYLSSTVISVSCNPGYKIASSNLTLCIDGNWNPTPLCVPDCGKIDILDVILIEIGLIQKLRYPFPWNVHIFYKYGQNVYYLACLGTLIAEDKVMMAANCAESPSRRHGASVEISNFRFAFGDAGRNFTAIDQIEHEIRIPEKFTIHNNYTKYRHVNNIAVASFTKKLPLSEKIMPVCIDIEDENSIITLRDDLFTENSILFIGGSGYVGRRFYIGDKSRAMQMNYTNLEECTKEHPLIRTEVFNDKFCSKFAQGNSICSGDYGAGLSILREDEKWYLIGIAVSTPRTDLCLESKHALFTSINYFSHTGWLKQFKQTPSSSNSSIIFPTPPSTTTGIYPTVDPDLSALIDEIFGPAKPTTSTPPPPPLIISGSSPQSPDKLFSGNGSCLLRSAPFGTKFTIRGCYATHTYDSGVCNSRGETPVPEGTVLDFSCESGFQFEGFNKFAVCLTGSWTAFPRCVPKPVAEISAIKKFRTCVLPEQPDGGFYIIDDCAESDPDDPNICASLPGEEVPSKVQLSYTCNPGYKLSNLVAYSFCVRGSWSPAVPSCKTASCPPIRSSSVAARCRTARGSVSCDQAIESGTVAVLKCNSQYQLAQEPGYRVITCRSNGTWDKPVFECVPKCGSRLNTAALFISGGNETKTGDFPWHVALYENQNGNMSLICGGTIIASQWVVTAAHCFTRGDPDIRKENFKIVAGKYYLDWNSVEEDSQVIELDEIHIPEGYKGRERQYSEDIAVVELLNSIIYKWNVQPVCMDWDEDKARLQLQDDEFGSVSGWGYTDGRGIQSNTLLTAQLAFINIKKCWQRVPPKFRSWITTDKFCAGKENGVSVCPGDSGGGLVFEHDDRYYLQGIVSIGPTVEDSRCAVNQYAAFTAVSKYLSWIATVQFKVIR